MFIYQYVLLGSCLIFISAQEKCNITGYYWKDFTGDIPPDALPGIIHLNKTLVYLGQVFVSKRIISVAINYGDGLVYYRWSNKIQHTDTAKVLCTLHPENFEWIKVNISDIVIPSDKSPVFVGSSDTISYGFVRMKVGNHSNIVARLEFNGKSKGTSIDIFERRGVTSHEILTYRK